MTENKLGEKRKNCFDALQNENDENQFRELQNNNVDYFKSTQISANVIEHALASGNDKTISQMLKAVEAYPGKMDFPLKTYQLAVHKKQMDVFRKLLKRQKLGDAVLKSALYKIALDENDSKSIEFFNTAYKRTELEKINKPNPSRLGSLNLCSKNQNDDVVDSQNVKVDALQEMRIELNKLHIRSDPRYLFTNEDDPIKTTISISQRLVKYKKEFPQNRDEIEILIKRCQNFMLTIVGLCETNDEVECLLNKKGADKKIDKHGRLWQALDGELVECIAHPNTQSWLYSKWLGDLSHIWETMPWKARAIHVLPRFLFFPITSLYYSVVPDRKIAPINCFIHSVASYYFFLFALLVTIFEGTVLPTSQLNNAHHFTTFAQYIVILWLISYFFLTIIDFIFITYPSHRHSWWTIYQFVMLCMFWIFGICHLSMGKETSDSSRKSLSIIKDGCFAVAVTMAFMKLLHWFHLSPTLGPVIISFSKMTTVICQMMVIFAVVLFSFSFGMHSLYRNADFPDPEEDDHLDDDKNFFNNYVNTLKMLFWVIFGYGRANAAGIPVNNDISDFNVTDVNNSNQLQEDQKRIIAQIGYYMWAMFHVTFVVVLLNMLIAIMTTTYESIQEKSDTEWKRARTKIWLYYMGKHNAVPPPFNVVKYLRNGIIWLFNIVKRKKEKSRENCNKPRESDNSVAVGIYSTAEKLQIGDGYEALICELASRYRTKYWIELDTKKGELQELFGSLP